MDTRDLVRECSNIFLVGSQMYGLAVEGSDEDFLQIYFDREDYVRPFPLYPEEVQLDNNNYKVYSLAKFARLLAKGNPNIVEVVYETPVIENCDTVTHFMNAVKGEVVHRGLAEAFAGHLKGLEVEIEKKGVTPKRLSHAIRVCHSLEHLLIYGELLPYRNHPLREVALAVKKGEIDEREGVRLLNKLTFDVIALYRGRKDTLPDSSALRASINTFFKEIYG